MYDNKGVIALAIVFVVVALLLVRNTNEVVDWYVDSTHVGQRTGGDFIGGDQGKNNYCFLKLVRQRYSCIRSHNKDASTRDGVNTH